MLIWGNKQYAIDKMIEEIKKDLADLLWGNSPIEKRWDFFRKKSKGFGPAIMSELLCMINPKKYYLWNRRAYVGLNYLEAEGLFRYNYQITGEKYLKMYPYFQTIQEELTANGFKDADFLLVYFFIGDEILARIMRKPNLEVELIPQGEKEREFLHDEVRDKLTNIGKWMGFSTNTEVKVAEGSVVDVINQ